MLGTALGSELLGEREKVSEIGTGAEGSRDAGDDRDPRGGIRVESFPRRRQVCEVDEVERIAPFGSVDDDAYDMPIVELVVDGHGLPGPSWKDKTLIDGGLREACHRSATLGGDGVPWHFRIL